MLTENAKAIASIGVKNACELSGIMCATAVCVIAALSSIVFLIWPDGLISKNLKLESVNPSIPIFLRLVSNLKASLCEVKPEIRYNIAAKVKYITIFIA